MTVIPHLDPFPHWVIDDFLDEEDARLACAQFPEPDRWWTLRHHLRSQKSTWSDWRYYPPALFDLVIRLHSPGMLKYFSALTGIESLQPDNDLFGGGLHFTGRGGFLGIHADFTHHPHTGFRRVLNLLIYFNPEWRHGMGGELELWSKDMKHRVRSYGPLHNRAILFETSPTSYHGHPDPFSGEARRSLALYYYVPDTGGEILKTTDYRPRPTDYRHRLRRWVKGWVK